MDFYFDKCDKRELWLQYCPECQITIFYPRGRCPHCLSNSLKWKPASGRAKLHAYTVVHVSALPEFAEMVPYVYALVDLEEGVRIASNIIDCPLSSLIVDMPLNLAWVQRNGRQLPVFRPVKI